MNPIERVHDARVLERRVRRLCAHLAPLLPEQGRVLDVGCGDGRIAAALKRSRPDIDVEGIDVLVRETTAIPVKPFDGIAIPHADRTFDAVLLIDTVHHAADPRRLLQEAARVSRRIVLIKDHTRDGWLADATLRFMDDVGNKRHGVVLPHTYWSSAEWRHTFDGLGVHIQTWKDHLGLYPWPASLLFDRSLHFIAALTVPRA